MSCNNPRSHGSTTIGLQSCIRVPATYSKTLPSTTLPQVPAEALAAADLARLDAKVAAEKQAMQERVAAAAQAKNADKTASKGMDEEQRLYKEAHQAEPMLAS